jgi:hypothetical protein
MLAFIPIAARTIAVIPARTAFGNAAQASTMMFRDRCRQAPNLRGMGINDCAVRCAFLRIHVFFGDIGARLRIANQSAFPPAI